MDPLAALSLAGNVIQFVDFGSKLLSQGYELYKSTSGQLTADEELELITADLSSLISKIRLANLADYKTITSTPTSLLASESQQSVFEKICDEAMKIAQEILTKLNTLRINSTRNREAQILKQLWKRLWSKAEINELLSRLSRLKNVIDTEVLSTILQNTNDLKIQTSARFDSLDQQTKCLLTSLQQSNQAMTREMVTAISQLVRRLEISGAEQQRCARDVVTKKQKEDLKLHSMPSIIPKVEMFAAPPDEENDLRNYVQKRILDNLKYPAMSRRYESVVDAHPTTYEWAFWDSASESYNWTNLGTWLKSGKGLYWINGKPGSGKSTLMKYVYDDSRLRPYLNIWAQKGETTSIPLLIGTFFFWDSGTPEQRSQIGMLRALLFQILEQEPQLIPVVFPALWAKEYGKWLAVGPSTWSGTWTLRLLMTAFRRLITQRELDVKLFFLVDGLDEFDGDCEVLAELFNEIIRVSDNANQNIKCCVSSRPWVVFGECFRGCPCLQLQDLTFNDIQKFADEKFKSNSAFQKLAVQEPQATSHLVQEVVCKADGVFLWVHIVVKELLRGIRNRDKIPDLMGRLEALPRDLEPLYHRIMSQIDPPYLVWASKVFQIVRATREIVIPTALGWKGEASIGLISLTELYFALDEGTGYEEVDLMSQEALDDNCEEMEYQITARCVCLLEVTSKNENCEGLVQYLHRTARDFLETESQWRGILSHTQGINFDPFWQMFRLNSLMIHWELRRDRTFLDRGYLHNTTITMLHLAARAYAHNMSRTQKIRILDDANDLLLKHKFNIMRDVLAVSWNDHEPKEAISQSVRGPVIACALAINIFDYIDAKLNDLYIRDPVAARAASTLMLSGHLRSTRNHNFTKTRGLSLEMASVLIKYGANVNYNTGRQFNISIWEDFLTQGFIRSESTEMERYLSPDFVPIMILFLSSGADGSVSINRDCEKPINLLEFFESFILPNHPSQAGELRGAIVKASRFKAVNSQKSRVAANSGGNSSHDYASEAPETGGFSFKRMMWDFLFKS